MTVTVLLEAFASWPKCVVDVDDIAHVIVDRGFVHSINFVPFDEDLRDLLGLLVRWESNRPYGHVTEHVAVCYNKNADPWLQRIICCKEMIHIFENGQAATSDRDAVAALLDGLFPHTFGLVVSDVFRRQALRDRTAIFQATNVMFPKHHRVELEADVAAERLSLADVAGKMDVPVEMVDAIFSVEWKAALASSFQILE